MRNLASECNQKMRDVSNHKKVKFCGSALDSIMSARGAVVEVIGFTLLAIVAAAALEFD